MFDPLFKVRKDEVTKMPSVSLSVDLRVWNVKTKYKKSWIMNFLCDETYKEIGSRELFGDETYKVLIIFPDY